MCSVIFPPASLYALHADRISPEPLPHVQLVAPVHFYRCLGRSTHHVPFAFIRSLAQVLASLGELVRVMLETFRGQSPLPLNAIRLEEARFQCSEQRRARRRHGGCEKSVDDCCIHTAMPFRALLRSTPSLAPVPRRAVLAVSGSDAAQFLNGLLANSVQGYPSYSALLHAQGRVLHDVFLFTSPASPSPTYLIDHDPSPSESPPLLAVLKRFVLRSKVRIRDVTQEWDVWAAWGERTHAQHRSWQWAASGAIEPVWRGSFPPPWGTEHGIILDRRAPGMGRRLLVRKGDTRP